MIEIIEAFGHKLLKFKVPLELYDSKSLNEDIDDLFNTEFIKTIGSISPEQRGIGYSTCHLENNSSVTNLTDISLLIDYITGIIVENFYQNPNQQIFYPRIWINKIFKHCSGTCHIHSDSDVDGVVIFYYSSPKNSSKLIVLKDNIEGEVREEHFNISHFIDVSTGDLLIHKNDVPHAVSEHLNDEPRICFIFEFGKL
jgi:hypothetical protein